MRFKDLLIKCWKINRDEDPNPEVIKQIENLINELKEALTINCHFCGEPLEDGDICFGCYEAGCDEAFDDGKQAGYKEGNEEGKREGRSAVLSEIEFDPFIPSEAKCRIRRWY
jgi:flagellar biosynthesis/type III secretory pathway protein FliH